MTRRFLVGLAIIAALLVGAVAPSAADHERDYVAAPMVHEHQSPDPTNRFFELSFRNDLGDDTNAGVAHVGIITTKDAALAEWLASHDGQRISLSLRGGSGLSRDSDER